jgi:hypothetical protein
MSPDPGPPPAVAAPLAGKIIEAEIKVSVDPGQPLPLVCALYAVESEQGVWLCSYYGSNRSVFDFLPQKGAAINERTLGITFHSKELIPHDRYSAALWEEFKKTHLMTYGRHA